MSYVKNQRECWRERKMVQSNRHLAAKKISEDLNFSCGSIQSVLTRDLSMKWQNFDCQTKATVCQFHWSCSVASSESSFLKNVIMGDETWVYDYDPETKVPSSQWKITCFSSWEKKKKIPSMKIQGDVDCIFRPRWNCVSWVCTQEHYNELWIL